MLSAQTKIYIERENLILFKSAIREMRKSKNFDLKRLARKISPFCKTSIMGSYMSIRLKHSKIGLAFTLLSCENIEANSKIYMVIIHFVTGQKFDSHIMYVDSQKEFLEKVVLIHKYFE